MYNILIWFEEFKYLGKSKESDNLVDFHKFSKSEKTIYVSLKILN